MAVVSRVELFAAIRRDAREGVSGRKIQRKHGVSYRTVQQALTSAWPTVCKEYTPRPSKLEPFKPIIDAIRLADLDAPRKQRHTLTRLYRRLVDEHGMTEVSYPVIGRYVRQRRPETLVATGRAPSKVLIPPSARTCDGVTVRWGDPVLSQRISTPFVPRPAR